MKYRDILMYTVVGITGAALCWSLSFQWHIRARVLLAMQGHCVVKLVSPTNAQSLEGYSGTFFVSKIVYQKSELIGFLDTRGDYVKLGASGPNLRVTFWYTWAGYVLFWGFTLLSAVSVLVLLTRSAAHGLGAFKDHGTS